MGQRSWRGLELLALGALLLTDVLFCMRAVGKRTLLPVAASVGHNLVRRYLFFFVCFELVSANVRAIVTIELHCSRFVFYLLSHFVCVTGIRCAW